MKIAVSFCNQKEAPTDKNLVVIDFISGQESWISFGEIINGITGLSQNKDYIFLLYQGSENGIAILDKKTLKIILKSKLENVADPHSLVIDDDGNIYVVSTGNDRVSNYFFNKDNRSIEYVKTLWRPNGSEGKTDTHHVNSIFLHKDHLYVSAFGPKKSERWYSADDGYVYDITENKKIISNIYHPHSVFVDGKDVYYCESSSRSVKKNYRKIISLDAGYTRGLAIYEDYILLGTSSGRKNSKSTGVVNNPADPGSLEASCKLLVYKKNLLNRYKLHKSFDFLPGHTEIYDVLTYEEF